MIVIIEGPDCAGKTTLLQRISERLTEEVHFVHRGPIERSVEEEYIEPLSDYGAMAIDVPVLIDRWHIGEMVYGPILRGESKLSPLEAYKIDLKLETIGAYKIFLTEKDSVLLERLRKDGDDLVDEDRLVRAAFVYEDLMYNAQDWVRMSSSNDPDIQTIIWSAENRHVSSYLFSRTITTALGSSTARLAVIVPEGESKDIAIRAAFNRRIRPDEIVFVDEEDAHKLASYDITGRMTLISPMNHPGHAHRRFKQYSIKELSEVIF